MPTEPGQRRLANLRPPRAEVSHDGTEELVRRPHLEAPDRLQQGHAGLGKGLPHRHGQRREQRHRGIRGVTQLEPGHADRHVHDREPAGPSGRAHVGHDTSNRLLQRRRQRGRMVRQADLHGRPPARPGRSRPRRHVHHGSRAHHEVADPSVELPHAAPHLGNRLPVRHARATEPRVHVEIAPHPVAEDFEVQLAHAREDQLPGLLVEPVGERGILPRQAFDDLHQSVAIRRRLWLDSHRHDRFRELDRLEGDPVLRIAEGVAGDHVLQARHGDDVAAFGALDGLGAIGVNPEEPSKPRRVSLRG